MTFEVIHFRASIFTWLTRSPPGLPRYGFIQRSFAQIRNLCFRCLDKCALKLSFSDHPKLKALKLAASFVWETSLIWLIRHCVKSLITRCDQNEFHWFFRGTFSMSFLLLALRSFELSIGLDSMLYGTGNLVAYPNNLLHGEQLDTWTVRHLHLSRRTQIVSNLTVSQEETLNAL